MPILSVAHPSRRLGLVLLPLTFTLCLRSAEADTIQLKDGKRVEGTIVEQNDKIVVLERDGLQVTYQRELIERVEQTSTVASVVPYAQVKWKYAPPGLGRGAITSPPKLHGSWIYFRTTNNRITALDANSGEERWSCDPKGHFDSGPILTEGQGYYGAKDGRLVAFRPETCEMLWSFTTQEAKQRQAAHEAYQRQLGYVSDEVQEAERFGLEHSVISDPVTQSESVYFSFNAVVYAVNAKTGEQRWRTETGNYVVGPPVVGQGLVYVSSQDGSLYALEERSGRVRWRYAFERDWPGRPVLDGTSVITAPTWGPIYVLNAENGTLERQISTDKRPVDGDLVAAEDILYVSINHILHAVELATGRRLWKSTSEMGAFLYATGAPYISESMIYATDGIGQVVAIDRATGQKRWAYKTEGRVFRPLEADGVVYAASQDGTLYALAPPAVSSSALVASSEPVAPVIEPSEESVVRLEESPALRWKFAPQNVGIRIPPIIADGRLYSLSGNIDISTSFYSIVSLDPLTGTKQAELTPGGDGLRVAEAVEQGKAFVYRYRDTYPKAMIVQAVDIQSGAVKWQREFPGEVLWVRAQLDEGPLVSGGVAYIQPATGELHALDATTGDTRWTIAASEIKSGRDCLPMHAVVESMFLSLCRGLRQAGIVEAFDTTSGKKRWVRLVDGSLWQAWRAKPSAAEGILYIGSGDQSLYGRLYAIHAATGTVAWEASLDSVVVSTAVAANGRVFVGCEAGHLHALDQTNGAEQWKVQLALNPTQAVVLDGSVFIGAGDDYRQGGLYAVDAVTGQIQWQFKLPGAINAPPLVTTSMVYAGTDHNRRGRVYAVDRRSGTLVWHLSLGEPVRLPIVAYAGLVYIVGRSKLYALNEVPTAP